MSVALTNPTPVEGLVTDMNGSPFVCAFAVIAALPPSTALVQSSPELEIA